ncbi:hypothetical protein SAMN02910447_01410 [Ruminococcus sp. YE71]|uniref:hypothetical protein n=1 Tax=unclassified Ruminococcus TaxID=2608920 RepID=UPI0008889E5F|nr:MULTISPECIES: hypothetical protein [unclassified Ruminococcus]SDA19103.1 hypothetical protein SAMN02910446_01564 [Ruminococcus sp. YE78]SFW28685.1 hypothetical protein SAMN02910447_01410 [Ruminococcus sp. YE71]
MNIDKAKVNAAVKKVKEIRAESERKKREPKKADFPYQVGSEREMTLIGLGLAMALAVLMPNKKKKPFAKRVKKWYGRLGGILGATVGQQLNIDKEQVYKDAKLNALEIENAVKFEL